MSKKFKNLLSSKGFIRFLYHFTMIYSRTLRLRFKNEDEWINYIKNGKPVILCCWHQQFFSMIRRGREYGKYNPAIMISQSRDGELISDIANLCGWPKHTTRKDTGRANCAQPGHRRRLGIPFCRQLLFARKSI